MPDRGTLRRAVPVARTRPNGLNEALVGWLGWLGFESRETNVYRHRLETLPTRR
jgi:hypothetical protein